MNAKHKIFLFIVFFVFVAADCTSAAQVLRFGMQVSGMGTLDPHFAAQSQDRAAADMIFNGLLRYQPGNAPIIEPDLAKAIPDFKIVNGKQVWMFELRKGVLFHPGPGIDSYELTADDVVYSLKKSADPKFSAYAGEYSGMRFEKTDTYTLKIILEKPLSPIMFLPKITNYAGGFIVSKRAIESMGYEKYKAHPIGTGAFMFESHYPGQTLTLKASKLYFRGKPKLEGVEIHFLPDIEDREAGLLAGSLDLIGGSGEPGWIETMEQEPNIVINLHGVGEVATLYFNTTQKPLDDIRVRRAIAYALDRQEFISTSNRRMVEKVYSPVPEQYLPGGMTKTEVEQLELDYALNVRKAKKLLALAGYPDGFSLDLVASEKRTYLKTYEIVQAQLEKVAIQCKIKIVSHSVMHKMIRNDRNSMLVYIAWRPNADVYLTRFFHSDAIVVSGSKPDTNFSHYDKIDDLIEAARLEIHPDKQIMLWKQAQVRILSDVVAYPLYISKQCYASRSNVEFGHDVSATMALYPVITEKTVKK